MASVLPPRMDAALGSRGMNGIGLHNRPSLHGTRRNAPPPALPPKDVAPALPSKPKPSSYTEPAPPLPPKEISSHDEDRQPSGPAPSLPTNRRNRPTLRRSSGDAARPAPTISLDDTSDTPPSRTAPILQLKRSEAPEPSTESSPPTLSPTSPSRHRLSTEPDLDDISEDAAADSITRGPSPSRQRRTSKDSLSAGKRLPKSTSMRIGVGRYFSTKSSTSTLGEGGSAVTPQTKAMTEGSRNGRRSFYSGNRQIGGKQSELRFNIMSLSNVIDTS